MKNVNNKLPISHSNQQNISHKQYVYKSELQSLNAE